MYKYSHGANAVFEHGSGNILDLSGSINPLGMPLNVEAAIVREIKNIIYYPDNFSALLREKTAAFEKVKPDWIFFGSGASDIIFRLPKAAAAKKVFICSPTYSDYERSAASYGAKICRYIMTKENNFTLDENFIETVRFDKPNLVFICNPNNPTGKILDKKLIKELLDHFAQTETLVVIDECFIDFTEHAASYTCKSFLNDYMNLVILKAFTKIFALPGIRLGYALCANINLIDSLYCHGADWAVSDLAQAAGLAALDGADAYIRQTVDYVKRERSAIEKELSCLGFTVFKSSANYVFFQSPFSFDLGNELNKKNIRIRSCGNFHGLDNTYFRMAVSTKENSAGVLHAIKEVLNGK